MFKRIWSYGKKKTKKHLNVTEWANYDGLRESASWLGSLFRKVFKIPEPKHSESFEEAMVRLHLSEKTLKQRRSFFLQMAWLYLACFAGLLVYSHQFLYKETGSVWVLLSGYCVSLFVLTQAFRYSYWCCQIARRQLGCSMADWLKWLLGARS